MVTLWKSSTTPIAERCSRHYAICFVVLFYYTLVFKGRLARQPVFSSRFRNVKHFYVLSPYSSRYRYVWTDEIDSKMLRVHNVCTGLKNAYGNHGNFHKWLNSQISHGWAWDSGYPSCIAPVFVEASILDRCWAAVLAFTSILNLHKGPSDFFSAFDIN